MRPNQQETADSVTFTKKILDEKINFLHSDSGTKLTLEQSNKR